MQAEATKLPGVMVLRPHRFADGRGWFSETWNRASFQALGLDLNFIQDNLSLSERRGTVRGLHYQRPPFAQAKLVQVLKGRILDVAVDLRSSSVTFGHWLAVELSADEGAQLLIPAGFAHGFCTLEPDVLVAYKVDAPYSPSHQDAIHWQDADLGISWPVPAAEAALSGKDLTAGPFAGREHGF